MIQYIFRTQFPYLLGTTLRSDILTNIIKYIFGTRFPNLLGTSMHEDGMGVVMRPGLVAPLSLALCAQTFVLELLRIIYTVEPNPGRSKSKSKVLVKRVERR